MRKQTNVIIGSIFLIFVMSYLLVISSFAEVIDFQGETVGTVITNQYEPQGVEFNSGVIDQDYMGGLFLCVQDKENPFLEITFTNQIYMFSAKVYETNYGFEAQPEPQPNPDQVEDPSNPGGDGPETSDPDVDLPSTDESKPDESIYSKLYFTNNTIFDLDVIHAFGEWKELSFQTTLPVEKLSLLGHYNVGSDPIYFFIDDISFSTAGPVPEPSSLCLFLCGLYWLTKLRKK